MIEVGRVCYKIAGREAGKPAVIIDVKDEHYAIIDGIVRRKKCNLIHLIPVNLVLKIKKNAPTEEVIKAMIDAKLITRAPKKGEKKEAKAKETKHHMQRAKEEKPAKKEETKKEPKAEAKKEAKKESKPKAEKKESKPKAEKKEAKPKKAKK
jgi:large subunit ribosomal protein L14e